MKFKYHKHDCATCLKKYIEDKYKVKVAIPKYQCKVTAGALLKVKDEPMAALLHLIKEALAPHKLTVKPLNGHPDDSKVVFAILSSSVTIDRLPTISIYRHGQYEIMNEDGSLLRINLHAKYLNQVYEVYKV